MICLILWHNWLQMFSASASMSLCNVTLYLFPSGCGVYFSSPWILIWPCDLTWPMTSVHLMQGRLERYLITESCPLHAFRTEPSCEEVWDKRDMCPIWVPFKSTSRLIPRHTSVIILDHPAPSWPYTHKWVQQISVKPPSQQKLNKIVVSRPLSLLCSQNELTYT